MRSIDLVSGDNDPDNPVVREEEKDDAAVAADQPGSEEAAPAEGKEEVKEVEAVAVAAKPAAARVVRVMTDEELVRRCFVLKVIRPPCVLVLAEVVGCAVPLAGSSPMLN